MARKANSAVRNSKPSKPATTPVPIATEMRNSAVPPRSAVAATPASAELSHETIAFRAYEIHLSGQGGSESDNWFRAERELRSGK